MENWFALFLLPQLMSVEYRSQVGPQHQLHRACSCLEPGHKVGIEYQNMLQG